MADFKPLAGPGALILMKAFQRDCALLCERRSGSQSCDADRIVLQYEPPDWPAPCAFNHLPFLYLCALLIICRPDVYECKCERDLDAGDASNTVALGKGRRGSNLGKDGRESQGRADEGSRIMMYAVRLQDMPISAARTCIIVPTIFLFSSGRLPPRLIWFLHVVDNERPSTRITNDNGCSKGPGRKNA